MEKRKRFIRVCVVFLLAVLVAFPSDMAAIQAKAAGSTGKSKILIAYFGRYGTPVLGRMWMRLLRQASY